MDFDDLPLEYLAPTNKRQAIITACILVVVLFLVLVLAYVDSSARELKKMYCAGGLTKQEVEQQLDENLTDIHKFNQMSCDNFEIDWSK